MSAILRAGSAAPVSTLVDQLDEPFLYHDPSRGGFVSFMCLGGAGQRQRTFHLSDLERGLAEMRAVGRDVYIAQNEFFRPNRRVVNCAHLTSLYLDLDTYRVPDLASASLDRRLSLVELACEDRGLPHPSLIVHSGRGLQLKWLLERPLPSSALPRWRVAQDVLHDHFRHLGSDPKALDAARVLRLVGTTSSRTGEAIRVVRVAETPTMGGVLRDGCVVYPFDELARTLLPFSREELALRRAAWEHGLETDELTANVRPSGGKRRERTRRAAVTDKGAVVGRWSLRLVPSQLAWDRLDDLRTIARLRGWENGAPAGQRNTCVFLAACFLAHVGGVTQFAAELREFARTVAPVWSESDIRSCTSSVVSRLARAQAGETVEFNGERMDPRYRFSNARLVELLELTDGEQRSLRTIVGLDEARRRDRERKATKRRSEGRMTRDDYLGRSDERAMRARELAATGLGPQAIAAAMGVGVTSVRRYLKG